MDLLLITFVCGIILGIIFIAEKTNMLGLGLISGVLFLFLGYLIYATDINYMTGQTTISTSLACPDLQTQCEQTTTLSNMTYVYSPVQSTPGIHLSGILAFMFVLCGLYTIIHYALVIGRSD